MTNKAKASIPEKFYKGDKQPIARNVGQLKKLLNELPDTLQIRCSFSKCVQLVVFNYKYSDIHLGLQDLD